MTAEEGYLVGEELEFKFKDKEGLDFDEKIVYTLSKNFAYFTFQDSETKMALALLEHLREFGFKIVGFNTGGSVLLAKESELQ